MDGDGNVIAAVTAGSTIEADNATTVAGQRMGAEGMGVVIFSPDLGSRRAWVLFSAGGGSAGESQSEAVGVSCSRSGLCAVVGQASGRMVTKHELKGSSAPPQGSGSGYLVLFDVRDVV